MQCYLKRLLILAISVCLLMKPSNAYAQTESKEWVNFYGTAQLDGISVTVGSTVEAFDSNGVRCGSYQVDKVGIYGYLACSIDDSSTVSIDEGINKLGDVVQFKIQGTQAESFTTPSGINLGDRFEVALHAVTPPVVVPEPITVTLMSLGLLGLSGYVYRKRRAL